MTPEYLPIALSCACPVCAAQPGELCRIARTAMQPPQAHAERLALARSLMSPTDNTPTEDEFDQAVEESGLV